MSKRPDYNVVVSQKFTKDDGTEGIKWFKVGSGWKNANNINFNIITLPGVNLYLMSNDDKP